MEIDQSVEKLLVYSYVVAMYYSCSGLAVHSACPSSRSQESQFQIRFHSKARFPYTLSARLAGKLWLNMTDVRTIIQVIYETEDVRSDALSRYVKELVSDGNHVVTAIDTG